MPFKMALFILFTVLCLPISLRAQTIRYVKQTATGSGDGSSWANASSNLQNMINASVANDEVWVAAGTYRPTKDAFGSTNPSDLRNRTFYIKTGVEIYGGFNAANPETTLAARSITTNVTTLSGDFSANDIVTGTGSTLSITNNTENAYHVVLASTSLSAGTGVTIDGFTIKGGNASVNSSITLSGNSIPRNFGGGLYIAAGNNTLNNNTFSGNSSNNGGGIYLYYGNSILSNNTFSGNSAITNGGGIYTAYSTNTLSNSTFSGNLSDKGGGIYTYYSTSIMSYNTFSGNSSSSGGGVYTNYGTSTVSNSSFSGNSASQSGGGIATSLGINIISDNTISSNSAGDGGGISVFAGTNTITNNTILGNSASGGGGVSLIDGENTLTNNTISGSSATQAGGIYIFDGVNSLNSNTISGNSATTNAGGIYIYYGVSTLNNNIISNNSATTYGGGFYIFNGINTLSNNTISDNSAGDTGGGIFTTEGTNTFNGNTISDNSSSVYGGGVFTELCTNSISNNTFSGNLAGYGGGIYIYSDTTKLINNTFSSNSAITNGGGIYTNTGIHTITNNIIWGNKIGTNAAIAGADYYALDVNGNTFKNNLLQLASSNYPVSSTGTYAIGTAATGNIFAQNPLFADVADIDGIDNIHRTADDGLALQAASPAINTGITPNPAVATDILGNSRLGNYDMGAYEGQPCNTPSTYNVTGGGTYCAGGSGVVVGLANSDIGIRYQLKNGTTNVGAPVNGTGSAISFGNQTTAATYTVQATRAIGGCTATMTGSAIVTISINLTASITGATTGCGSVSLTATGGATYTWSNSTNTAAATFTASGIYSVTVSSAAGCTASTSTNVTVNTVPSASITGTTTACSSVSLTATGGTAYAWSNGINTAAATFTTSGTYNVTVTNAAGCTASASQVLTVNALPSVTATVTNVSCNSGANGAIDLTVTGGSSAYIYAWSNNATTQDLSNLVQGTYNVTVTDNAGCSASATSTVTQPTMAMQLSGLPTITNVTCNGLCNGSLSDVIIVGGTTPYTYSWEGPNGFTATTANLPNLCADSYTGTVTDANGCTYSPATALTITQPDALTVTLTPIDATASTTSITDGSVTSLVSGGVSAYTYIWSNSATTANLSAVAAGIYNVTISDSNGCTTTATTVVGPPVGAANIEVVNNFNLFPNPSNGNLTITFDLATAQNVALSIFNINGQLLKYVESGNQSNIQFNLDLSTLTAGVYIARFSVDTETFTKPIVLVK